MIAGFKLTAGEIGRLRKAGAGAASPPRRVMLLEWLDPPFSSGHWNPEIIERAGGREILGQSGIPSRRLTWKQVAAARPEVVIVAPCGFTLEMRGDRTAPSSIAPSGATSPPSARAPWCWPTARPTSRGPARASKPASASPPRPSIPTAAAASPPVLARAGDPGRPCRDSWHHSNHRRGDHPRTAAWPWSRNTRSPLIYGNIQANPIAHGGRQFAEFRRDFEAGGLDRWTIGGLYYGRLYDGEKRTDLSLLERAVQDHGIGCVKQILAKKGRR